MQFIKRIFLFLLTNIAVLLTLNIVLFLVQRIFGIQLSGYGVDAQGLLGFAFLVGFTGAIVSLFISKWTAKSAYNIQIISTENLHNVSRKERLVYEIVQDISQKNAITMPEVGVYKGMEMNAFATGASKNSSLVAVSSGLLENMRESEIEGVLGHEMSHILNGDMVTMTLMQGVVNTFVVFLSRAIASIVDAGSSNNNSEENSYGQSGPSATYFLVSMVLELCFSILASILVMWFSRYREYRADEGSARFVGKEKMIGALNALRRSYESVTSDNAPLSAYKISSREKGGFRTLFSSHPSLESRISNIENMRI